MPARNTNYQRIPVAGLRLEKQDSMSCNGYMLGGLQIGNEKLHFEAIRVADEEQVQDDWGNTATVQQPFCAVGDGLEELAAAETPAALQSYYCSCAERFRDLSQLSGEGRFTSQRLSGHEGEWVLYATPYMQ